MIEFILYSVVSSSILVAFSAVFFFTIQLREKNHAIAELNSQAAQIIQIITHSIKNAESVNAPLAGEIKSNLNLAVSVSQKNPSVFYVNGSGKLIMKEGVGPENVLNTDNVSVESVKFENLSENETASMIKIILTLSCENPGGRNEYDFNNTFYGSAILQK